jgi:hypothetical protein
MNNSSKKMKGTFVTSLKRYNKQIRDDRALSIAEDAQQLYKRELEDVHTELKRAKRDRDGMLDFGAKNTTEIISASDFVARRIELGLKIRNLEIRLEVASDDYNALFTGKTSNEDKTAEYESWKHDGCTGW